MVAAFNEMRRNQNEASEWDNVKPEDPHVFPEACQDRAIV